MTTATTTPNTQPTRAVYGWKARRTPENRSVLIGPGSRDGSSSHFHPDGSVRFWDWQNGLTTLIQTGPGLDRPIAVTVKGTMGQAENALFAKISAETTED